MMIIMMIMMMTTVCDLVYPFISHISATVGLRSMHSAFMASSVRGPRQISQSSRLE